MENNENNTRRPKTPYYSKDANSLRKQATNLLKERYWHEQEQRTTTVYPMGRLRAALEHLKANEGDADLQTQVIDLIWYRQEAARCLAEAANLSEKLPEGFERVGLGRARTPKIAVQPGGFANITEKHRGKYMEGLDLTAEECVGLEVTSISKNGKNARCRTRTGTELFIKMGHLAGTESREGEDSPDPDADFPVEDVDVAHAVNL